MADKRRLNLSFSLTSPQQREAWRILSSIPVGQRTDTVCRMVCKAHEQDALLSTLGNRPDLFPSSGYIGKYITNRPPEHEVPESYLDDETFAAILKEAEKYLGFPYVWGGSSPSTSFDCSGFVSYVYNQCGWSFGRLGAQGLYNICSRTSSPRPGDLVFFVGTYDTAGISHVGIYVGDGWMLHCGDPISYANLNSSYWQSHLYAYGRLP